MLWRQEGWHLKRGIPVPRCLQSAQASRLKEAGVTTVLASLGVSLPCCGWSPGIPHCFLTLRAPALSLQRRGCKSSQVGKGAPATCGEAGRWADSGGAAA